MRDFLKMVFCHASISKLAEQELASAELALLTAQTGQEWAAANISYNQARIKRLKEFLDKQRKENDVSHND
jgi:hypothetical protein